MPEFFLQFDKITSLISGLVNISEKYLKTYAGSDVSKISVIIGHLSSQSDCFFVVCI